MVQETTTWAAKRMLGLFNSAAIAADISHHRLLSGRDWGIVGDIVAQRIIDRRNQMTGMRFMDLAQLHNIKGLGDGKLGDILSKMSVPSAEAFREGMYDRVLREAFILEHHDIRFQDEEQFLHVAGDSKVFREWVEGRVVQLVRDRHSHSTSHYIGKAKNEIKNCRVEVYEAADVAAHAFSLWLYKSTYNQWFAYDPLHREAAVYFDLMPDYLERTELRMFEGFRNEGLITGPISPTGLPVTVNYCEQVISIWTVQVID